MPREPISPRCLIYGVLLVGHVLNTPPGSVQEPNQLAPFEGEE